MSKGSKFRHVPTSTSPIEEEATTGLQFIKPPTHPPAKDATSTSTDNNTANRERTRVVALLKKKKHKSKAIINIDNRASVLKAVSFSQASRGDTVDILISMKVPVQDQKTIN